MRDRTARGAPTAGRARVPGGTFKPAVAALAGAVGTIAVTVGGTFVAAQPAAAAGEVSIEVSANGEPADSAPGPSVASGAAVDLEYVITVGSVEPLYDFVVANLTGDVKPDCDTDGDGQPNGTDGHPGPLSAGDSFSCTAQVVAGDPGVTYASVGRVTAYDFDITQTFVHEDVTHYTPVRPPTTQAPTTQAPTTATPATVTPTTVAATSTTTVATSASTTTSAATESTTSTTAPSAASSSSSSPSTAINPTTTSTPTDDDAAAPAELAATDDDSDAFPVWWVVLAFGIGGAIAVGISSHLADRLTDAKLTDARLTDARLTDDNATVPDQ